MGANTGSLHSADSKAHNKFLVLCTSERCHADCEQHGFASHEGMPIVLEQPDNLCIDGDNVLREAIGEQTEAQGSQEFVDSEDPSALNSTSCKLFEGTGAKAYALEQKAIGSVLEDPSALNSTSGKLFEGTGAKAYALEQKVIGSGRFAEVREALHLATGARRAIKVIKKEMLSKRDFQSIKDGLNCREVDILRRLDHPNVIRCYDAFEDESAVYLVMELCQGADLLERVNGTKGRLPEAEIAAVFVQALCAVEHLWSHGVAHRDLKPEHFVFTRREEHRDPLPPRVAAMKLIDFGLSRRVEHSKTVLAQMPQEPVTPRVGTIELMSPETVRGEVELRHLHKVDIWSLGVLLHIMLTGRYLSPRLLKMGTKSFFSEPCWNQFAPDCCDLLEAMVQQDPAMRPDVGVLLRHPFVSRGLDPARPELVQRLPSAVRAFSCSEEQRRSALLVAARLVDDCDFAQIRCLFQQLQLAFGGSLTRAALLNGIEGGPLAEVAAALASSFDSVDCNGSGTIDWSELLAVILGEMDSSE